MIIKEYDRAHKFLEDYEAVLLEREAAGQMILYNAFQYRNDNIVEEGSFGAVLQEDKVILIYCFLNEQNLIIYSANQQLSSEASIILAEHMAKSNRLVQILEARSDLCLSFIEEYKNHIEFSYQAMLGLDIMEARVVNEIKPIEGRQRIAKPEDARLLADWMIEYKIEALACELDYEAALKKVTKYIDENRVYLYENDYLQVVSMAIAARKLLHGMAITYVYTPEEQRGKGYAAANLYYMSRELLDQGYEFCTLFVDKKNPLASRAYVKVGYVILEDYYQYNLIPVEAEVVNI